MNVWSYNSKKFEYPEWHDYFSGHHGGPRRPVQVKVCELPNIVCAEFLGALSEAEGNIFNIPMVRACINIVWWGGAQRLDLHQLFLTIVALIFIVLQRAFRDDDIGIFMIGAWDESQNRSHDGALHARLEEKHTIVNGLVSQFIGARGICDLFHELAQFAGYCSMGKGCAYLKDSTNMLDIGRALLAVYFLYSGGSLPARVALILIYWTRLLEMSFSENLMRALLPLTRLAAGLLPSLCVCVIAMCAFSHALY